jgi:hypothetical protein
MEVFPTFNSAVSAAKILSFTCKPSGAECIAFTILVDDEGDVAVRIGSYSTRDNLRFRVCRINDTKFSFYPTTTMSHRDTTSVVLALAFKNPFCKQ